jgi:hypothetical protein
MQEFTVWFDKSTKPIHIGVYEVRRKPNGKTIFRLFSYWTGKRWSYTAQTPRGAESCKHKPSREAEREGGFEWRGLRRKKI